MGSAPTHMSGIRGRNDANVMLLLALLLFQPNPPSSIRVSVDGCWQCPFVDFSKPPLVGISAVIVVADDGGNVEVENPAVTFPVLVSVNQN